jgi:serine/threonine protein kinase
MEYADGDTLRAYLKKNTKLTWKNIYKFAHQLASAVSCLHNTGIVHRDLVILFLIIIWKCATHAKFILTNLILFIL